jgi:hypothetical protein
MILTMVAFRRGKPWSVEEAAAIFKSTAPKYLNRPGLIRKHYYVTESGDRAGGVYLWNSREDAHACYTEEWKAMVASKYGAKPEITYMNIPVTVDNVTHEILAP